MGGEAPPKTRRHRLSLSGGWGLLIPTPKYPPQVSAEGGELAVGPLTSLQGEPTCSPHRPSPKSPGSHPSTRPPSLWGGGGPTSCGVTNSTPPGLILPHPPPPLARTAPQGFQGQGTRAEPVWGCSALSAAPQVPSTPIARRPPPHCRPPPKFSQVVPLSQLCPHRWGVPAPRLPTSHGDPPHTHLQPPKRSRTSGRAGLPPGATETPAPHRRRCRRVQLGRRWGRGLQTRPQSRAGGGRGLTCVGGARSSPPWAGAGGASSRRRPCAGGAESRTAAPARGPRGPRGPRGESRATRSRSRAAPPRPLLPPRAPRPRRP